MTKSSRFRNALVTGGAGFLGKHLVDRLLKLRFRVRVIDNFLASSKKDFRPYLKKVELIEADIREEKAVRRAMKNVDAVFHLAAIRSVVKSVEDPFLAHEVNASASLLLLQHARASKVKHFIFTSTSSVYGAALASFQKERGPLDPISPYGVAKFAAEQYARYFYTQTGFSTSSVRIFNVYGTRQNPESRYSLLVPGILSRILKGKPPVIDGRGDQTRDFIYVDDVLDAFLTILGNKKAYGEVYNLGSGRTSSVRQVVELLLKLSGSPLKPVHGPRRPADPDRTCADISKLRALGWKPRISLEEGLKRVVDWNQKHA